MKRPVGLPRGASVFRLGPVFAGSRYERLGTVRKGYQPLETPSALLVECVHHGKGCSFSRSITVTPVRGAQDQFYAMGGSPASLLGTHVLGREHQLSSAHARAAERGSTNLRKAEWWWTALCRRARVVEQEYFGGYGHSRGEPMPAEWVPKWVARVMAWLTWESKAWMHNRSVPEPFYTEISELLAWSHAVGGTVREAFLLAWPDEGLLRARALEQHARMDLGRRACAEVGIDFDEEIHHQREDVIPYASSADFFLPFLRADSEPKAWLPGQPHSGSSS